MIGVFSLLCLVLYFLFICIHLLILRHKTSVYPKRPQVIFQIFLLLFWARLILAGKNLNSAVTLRGKISQSRKGNKNIWKKYLKNKLGPLSNFDELSSTILTTLFISVYCTMIGLNRDKHVEVVLRQSLRDKNITWVSYKWHYNLRGRPLIIWEVWCKTKKWNFLLSILAKK